MTIDIKSLAVGLLLGISIAFSVAANYERQELGRYQITSTTENDVRAYYVLDTRTGQVWQNESKPKTRKLRYSAMLVFDEARGTISSRWHHDL
jgi:hypothetical protein